MKIIVFSPHPDDAEAMMGGTIARYTSKGHEVTLVLATLPEPRDIRREESKKAADILGARLKILDLDPYTLTFDRKTVETFDGVFSEFTPDIVYTCWLHDSHQDHNTVARATIAAARKNTCSLYMCDHALPSGITPYVFRPQVFIDVTDTIDVKMKAVTAHDSQVQVFGNQWLEGIKAKAIHHGFQFHVEYAEAFEVVKEIKDI